MKIQIKQKVQNGSDQDQTAITGKHIASVTTSTDKTNIPRISQSDVQRIPEQQPTQRSGFTIPNKAQIANKAPAQTTLSDIAATEKQTTQISKQVVEERTNPTTGIDYPTQKDTVAPEVLAAFNDAVQALHGSLNKPELVGHVLRRIMIETRNTPELTEFMKPEDFGAMIIGLRNSYGNALEIKKSKQKKKKDKPASSVTVDDLADFMI
jgi:hypothetical protein